MPAPTNLFVNVNAGSLTSGLVRSLADMSPVSFPELVMGDGRTYNLYFVDGAGGYAAFSGDASYIPALAIGDCGFPSGGTFTLKFGANTTSALAWNASMAAIQTALQGLASIGAGNCTVGGSPGQYFTVTFTGSLGNAPQSLIVADGSLLTPVSNLNVFTITVGDGTHNAVQGLVLALNPVTFNNTLTPITNGWTGTLSSSTTAILAAMAAAGGLSFTKTFQVSVVDPAGNTTTYVKTVATIDCTLINNAAFAGANAPNLVTQAQLAAAVLGLNNFTQETLSSSATGNTNVTPGSTSRHHAAVIAITGAAGTRTFSLLTASRVAGDVVILRFNNPATAGIVLEVHNATSGGTLLATTTTVGSSRPIFMLFEYSGSAWVPIFDASGLLSKNENLAGIASSIAGRLNLQTLFSKGANKSANFTVGTTEDGYYYGISTVTGNVLSTLPNAATVGEGFLICLQKTEGSPYTVTTSPSTGSLSQSGQSMVLRSDGTNWVLVLMYNPASASVTVSGSVQNLYGITSLTGGGASNLDGLATANGSQPAYTIVMLSYGTPRASQVWQLVPGTDVATTGIVRPTDFDASINPQVWKQIG